LSLTLRDFIARVRCAVLVFILCRAAKNEPRKRAKGPNALWKPAARHEKSQIFLIVARKQTSSAFALVF
jgi:hypothetical protein